MICPKCGSKFNNVNCLASCPPQYEWNCNRCDFNLRYFERENSFNKITQEELIKKYEMEMNKNVRN